MNDEPRQEDRRKGHSKLVYDKAKRTIVTVDSASAPNSRPDRASGDRGTELTSTEINLCRQWFDSVQDVDPDYLMTPDYRLAAKLYEVLDMRVPGRIAKRATPLSVGHDASSEPRQNDRSWRDRCEALLDIWDDGNNLHPDARCYVPGALKAEMEELRAALQTASEPNNPNAVDAVAVREALAELLACDPDIAAYTTEELRETIEKGPSSIIRRQAAAVLNARALIGEPK